MKRICPNGHVTKDRKALKCSQCGADLPPVPKAKRWPIILAVVILLLLCGIIAIATQKGGKETAKVVATPAPTQAESTKPTEAPKPTATARPTEAPKPTATARPSPVPSPTPAPTSRPKIGDRVEIGSVAVTVNKAQFIEGTEYTKPDEGKRFYVVDLTIENLSKAEITVSSMLQMSMKDDTGQKYTMDLDAQVASKGTSPDGKIAAGDKLRGQLGFQVPKDAKGFVFYFDAALFGKGQAIIALD